VRPLFAFRNEFFALPKRLAVMLAEADRRTVELASTL
jgi:hypothetical protein